MKKLKETKIDWYILSLFLLGLSPLIWFRKGMMIAGGDESWIINPLGFLPDALHTWSDKFYNFGGPNIYLPYSQTVTPFWSFWHSLGLSNIFIEKLWIILLFMLPGISMYYLMRFFIKDQTLSRAGAFFSALFYMMNLFVIQIGPFQTNTKLTLIALPVVLLFFIKGTAPQKLRNQFVYSVPIAVILTLIGSAFVNIAVVSVIPIILIAYLVHLIITDRKSAWPALRFTLMTILFWALINIYWLWPYLQNMMFFNQSSGGSVFNFEQTNTGKFYNFWRFLGSWGWKEKHNFQYYFPYADLYDQLPLVVASYLPTLVALIALLKYRKNRFVLFFTLLAILGIFLAKGATPPFGDWYNQIFHAVKLLWIYREPWAKFTPIHVLAICALFGFGASYLLSFKIKWLRSGFVFAFLAFTVLATAYPLITGAVIWDKNTGLMRSNYVQVPSYWTELNGYLQDSTESNDHILLLPPTGYAVGYNWEHGFFAGDTPAMVLLDRPTLRYASFPTSYADNMINEMYSDLASNPTNIYRHSKQFGFRYILIDNDARYNYSDFIKNPEQVRHDSLKITAKIEDLAGLTKVFSSGSLALYRLPGDIDISPISLANASDGNPIASSFSKISPARYEISASQLAAQSYDLSLNTNYSAAWRAIVCQGGSCQEIEKSNHTRVNGYANGWKIKAAGGDTKIILEYTPEIWRRDLKPFSLLVLAFLISAWIATFLYTRKLQE